MKKYIIVFVIFVAFAFPATAGERSPDIVTGFSNYANEDKIKQQLIVLCDECANLIEELDALLIKYAREAKMNMAIINDKRQTAIFTQEENKKYFAGPMIDLPIPRSEQEIQNLNKKLKKAIDTWHEADWLLTRPKKELDYSNAYYFWLIKDLVKRGLYYPSHDTLLHMLIQDRIILRAHIGQIMAKLCLLLKEREEIVSSKE